MTPKINEQTLTLTFNSCFSPQMVVQLVGIDAIMLMEGRELVFLKLLDAEASKTSKLRDSDPR